jgi:uncharacterized protein YaiL (DUF2058 family)
MQNLREQLLKAGMVTKEQKQRTDQEKRRQRKQHGKGKRDDTTQAQQRQAYEAKLAAQRAADRERAAAQRVAAEAKETRLQIRHIIEYWKVPEEPGGTRRWYFVTRDQTIKYLYVSAPLAERLEAGELAIVERPDEQETPYVLIEHEAAEQIGRLDPQYVRFHNIATAAEASP